MFYKVEAIRSFSGSHEYDPNGEVVMTTRSRRHGDVCRAIYHYLLAGHWVRILDDDNHLVGGPFHPGAVLPVSFKAFAQSLDRSERRKMILSKPLQDQQAEDHAEEGSPSYPPFPVFSSPAPSGHPLPLAGEG